jgi:hypothetical protein
MNRANPIPNDEAQTCCGANGSGSLLEKAHIENAGEE